MRSEGVGGALFLGLVEALGSVEVVEVDTEGQPKEDFQEEADLEVLLWGADRTEGLQVRVGCQGSPQGASEAQPKNEVLESPHFRAWI